MVLCAWSDVFVKRVIGPINSQKHILILSLESYQWNDEISIGSFWHRTDFQTLEELEPVLHTGEGPLGYRTDIGILSEQAKALVNELL